MKLIVRLLVAGLLIFSTSLGFAGGIGPWPFGKEIKFPWKMIQGNWKFQGKFKDGVFTFKIKTNATGDKVLSIFLIDPDQCTVEAEGRGVLNGRYISAQMVSHGQTFNLTIHAFNSSDVSVGLDRNARLGQPVEDKVVMAVTMYPIGEPEHGTSFEIFKIGNLADPVCY